MSFISSVLSNQGFTPCRRGFSNPAVTSTVSVGRQGLSIQQPRQHQREMFALLVFVCMGVFS